MKLPKPLSYGKAPKLNLTPENDTGVSAVDVQTIRVSKKAPMKQIKANVRALTAKGQKFRISEFMRHPYEGNLNNVYEILGEEDQILAKAVVQDGIITEMVLEDDQPYQQGTILSALLDTIVGDADRSHCGLSVSLTDMSTEVRTIFERFGFIRTGQTVYKRRHGSIRPPSVPAPSGV